MIKVPHPHLDNFFSRAAKLTIYIPIAVILIAVGFKGYEMLFPTKSLSLSPAPTPRTQLSPAVKPPTIDLKGPYICQYQTEEASLSAYIKNKNVFISNQKKEETDYFVLKGDCLYMWEKGAFGGQKVCGLSQYVSLVEVFGQFNILGTLLPPGALSIGSLNSVNFTHAMESCRKRDFTNSTIFTVPSNVLFKNVSIEELKKSITPTPAN